jgi:hypothetical protein
MNQPGAAPCGRTPCARGGEPGSPQVALARLGGRRLPGTRRRKGRAAYDALRGSEIAVAWPDRWPLEKSRASVQLTCQRVSGSFGAPASASVADPSRSPGIALVIPEIAPRDRRDRPRDHQDRHRGARGQSRGTTPPWTRSSRMPGHEPPSAQAEENLRRGNISLFDNPAASCLVCR